MTLDQLEFREQVLQTFGASSDVITELLEYNKNKFDFSRINEHIKSPLEAEPFVSSWYRYKQESEKKGLYEVLQTKLVQLQFPIEEGVSQSESYRSATLRGLQTDEIIEATGLKLNHPELLELHMHSSFAGTVPIIICRIREDFVLLLQALIGKNEPTLIPDSMGACMIAGYNNWDRIRDYRKKWENEQGEQQAESSWREEFKHLIQRKELYQDRFILLNDGPYSAVPAENLGISETQWREKSLLIRREHECTHYLTKRLFSSMQNNMMDELIADYAGIVAANGKFRADWFLQFIGLENFPKYRQGARLENYRGKPVLTDSAFMILQSLLVAAAHHLQQVDERQRDEMNPELMIITLCSLTLEELASDQAIEIIELAIDKFKKLKQKDE